MKVHTLSNQSGDAGLPLAAHPPLALDLFIRQSGLSPATVWRYRKRQWLQVCTISGRHYVTREAIAEFNRRMEAGEFAGTVPNPSGQPAVDFTANIAGCAAGVYDFPGGRVRVPEGPRLIEPKAGEYSTINDFLTGVLGGFGAVRLCCWLKIAFEALRAGERRPGQALIIIGPPGCGKSVIQHQLITPILGGRSANPKSFFFGHTDFNAELVGAEHLLIEEIPSSSKRYEERQFFGERIKEIVANDTARLHKKCRAACTVSRFWRLSITLNDNPEKLRCLPPMTDDLTDKIIMLAAKPAPDFWQQFASESYPDKAFREAIERELPAFADYLLTMPIPEQLQGRRYGVTSHIPAEIAQTIFEGEPERQEGGAE